MHTATESSLVRRVTDRFTCATCGHIWQTTEVAVGESPFSSTDCARCGQVGPIHGSDHSSAQSSERRHQADHWTAPMPRQYEIWPRQEQTGGMGMTTDDLSPRNHTVASYRSPIHGFTVQARDGSIGKVDEATREVDSNYIVVHTAPWIFGTKVLV